jgi:diguanylate cyclase (GGDEF)-like protein
MVQKIIRSIETGVPQQAGAHVRQPTLFMRVNAWRRSLVGKITLVFLGGVIFAYGAGAFVGWSMFVTAASEQWRNQARINTQIASATLRSIYTYIAVSVDDGGQVDRIVTDQPIGDDESVLVTGFSPIDVLALVSAQTKKTTWLYRYDAEQAAFVSVAVAYDGGSGSDVLAPIHDPIFQDYGGKGEFATGFAQIDGVKHYIGLLPIVKNQGGEVIGAVATSIGTASELYNVQQRLLRNSLLVLLGVFSVTGIIVSFVAKRFLKPVPALIQATLRIANEETDVETPFRNRKDEIGAMATAIESLREAVVERGRLRQVRDMALQMEHMAHHDGLTGLPNRALLMKTMNACLEETAQTGKMFNVMLLDLDRFKTVNDTLGHASGDALLVSTASRVRSVLGPDDIAARLGGDEFAIVQRVNRNPLREGQKLASRILESISTSFMLDDHEVMVGTSIGIACAPAHGVSAGQLLQNADLGLYRAKAMGRGISVFYEEGMDMAVQDQHALEMDMKFALQNNEFELHYQPIINLHDGRIAAYEALVRWRHRKQGMIPPDKFIPLAEETGFIIQLGEWILQQACTDAMSWPDNIRLAVNLSAVQLRQSNIVGTVEQTLKETGLSPERLELEVTETVMLTGATSIAALAKLKESGVRIVLDDFGTGYASFGALRNVPFTKLKIDREFVAGLPDDATSNAIISAITTLARQVDMEITAEGVEGPGQVAVLKVAGCTEAQGYYFARPMPASQLCHDLSTENEDFLRKATAHG